MAEPRLVSSPSWSPYLREFATSIAFAVWIA
jgi:hypothetical protein